MQTEEFKNVWLDTHIYMMMPGEMETKDMANLVLGRFRDDIREMAQHFPVVVGEWCLSHNPKGMDAMSDWEKSSPTA